MWQVAASHVLSGNSQKARPDPAVLQAQSEPLITSSAKSALGCGHSFPFSRSPSNALFAGCRTVAQRTDVQSATLRNGHPTEPVPQKPVRTGAKTARLDMTLGKRVSNRVALTTDVEGGRRASKGTLQFLRPLGQSGYGGRRCGAKMGVRRRGVLLPGQRKFSAYHSTPGLQGPEEGP